VVFGLEALGKYLVLDAEEVMLEIAIIQSVLPMCCGCSMSVAAKAGSVGKLLTSV